MARWQLMQEYAQKSMSTTLPRNDFRSIGAPPGVFSHPVMPLMIGRSSAALEFRPAVGAVRQLRVLVVDEAAEVELAKLLLAAHLLLQRTGVVGDGALQHGGQVEHQRHGQQDRHDPCGDADPALAAPERGDALGHPLAGQREEQQRQRGAEGERQRQRDRTEPDGAGGTRDDDGGQNRPGARHVQHAKGQPEPETACPEPNCFCGSRENGFSRSASNCGKINPSPIATSATSATQRIASCGRCSSDSSAEPSRVTTLKLSTRPAITR